MFAPSYSLTRHVPGWLSTTPQLMVRALYDKMAVQSELTLTNHAGTKLDVGTLLKDARYDYQTLTSSRPHVADGDFAFATEISFSDARVDKGLHQQHFLDVTITSHLYSGSRYQELGDVTHSGRIKTGGTSISQTISTLAAPKRSDIQEALLQLVDTHANALSQTMLCLPLSATMTQRDDGLHVTIGARQGLGPNHLAMVSGHMTPWTILRVTKSDADGATLMPLNRQRNLAELSQLSLVRNESFTLSNIFNDAEEDIAKKHPPGTSPAHIKRMKYHMDKGMSYEDAHNKANAEGYTPNLGGGGRHFR